MTQALTQVLQQLAPSGAPCVSCASWAVVQLMNFEVVPQSVLSVSKTQAVGKGTVGYSLCLACLAQHTLQPNYITGLWEPVEENGA